MTSIAAPLLEIAVLLLGMVILMIEAFAGKIDKRVLAFAAITGLAIVLLASFFVVPSPSPTNATGFWSFYTADQLAIFFKQFALLTTILVLIMMIDYAPVVRSFFRRAAHRSGRICRAASFHLCRTDVPRFGDRLRFHLCRARARNRVVLCAGQFYPAQSQDARSGNEVSRTQRAFHGVSGVRNCVDFRRDRPDKSLSADGGTKIGRASCRERV